MRTIKSLNRPVSTIVVGRDREFITLRITFTDGTAKSARVHVGEVRNLVHGKVEGEGVKIRRSPYRTPDKQRSIDALHLSFVGEGPDLAIVSRAVLLRAARVSQ